jgi:signal transduction histidine kinase
VTTQLKLIPRTHRRWLIAAFVLVATAFFGATAYSQLSSAGIDDQATRIMTDAIPSIDRLSEARADLRGLQLSLSHHVSVAAESRGPDVTVSHFRAQLEEALSQYRALARSDPGERALHDREVQQPLAKLDEEIQRITAEVDQHHQQTAMAIFDQDVRPTIAQTTTGLWHLVEWNNAVVHRDVVTIVGVRRHAMWLAFILDALCVFVGLGIGTFALRTVSAYSAFMEGHHRILERRADELEQFAGRVAHDLLHPLSMAMLAVQLLERTPDDRERAQATRARLQRGLQRCNRLVTDLLAFARSGARPEAGGRANLREVLQDAAEEVRTAGGDVEPPLLIIEPLSPCAVACSTGVLTSVLSNLLRNAVKYTVGCSVRQITVRACEHGPLVRCEVEDTGPGIPPGFEDVIFEPYVRATQSSQPGIGLGLATVKRLCESHGGRVGVRSVVGKGCTFWFELPRARELSEGPHIGALASNGIPTGGAA